MKNERTVAQAGKYYRDKIERGETVKNGGAFYRLLKQVYEIGGGDWTRGLDEVRKTSAFTKVQPVYDDIKKDPFYKLIDEMKHSEDPTERAFIKAVMENAFFDVPVKQAREIQNELMAAECEMPGDNATVYDWLDYRKRYKKMTGKKLTYKELERLCNGNFSKGYFEQVGRDYKGNK